MNSCPVIPSFAHSMSMGVYRPFTLRIVILDHASPPRQFKDFLIA